MAVLALAVIGLYANRWCSDVLSAYALHGSATPGEGVLERPHGELG